MEKRVRSGELESRKFFEADFSGENVDAYFIRLDSATCPLFVIPLQYPFRNGACENNGNECERGNDNQYREQYPPDPFQHAYPFWLTMEDTKIRILTHSLSYSVSRTSHFDTPKPQIKARTLTFL